MGDVTVTDGERAGAPQPRWAPPVPQPAPKRPRWLAPVATGAAAACGCAAIALWDPGDGGTAVCWSKAVFGVDCPLCGGLRATNAMLRSDWLAAADHNVLVAVLLPVTAVLWAVWLVRSLQDRPFTLPKVPRWGWIAIGAFLLAFTVVRNLDVDVAWVRWLASDTS